MYKLSFEGISANNLYDLINEHIEGKGEIHPLDIFLNHKYAILRSYTKPQPYAPLMNGGDYYTLEYHFKQLTENKNFMLRVDVWEDDINNSNVFRMIFKNGKMTVLNYPDFTYANFH